MIKYLSSAFLFIILITIPVYAASKDDIVGIWNNEEKDAKIEIFKCAEKYCGKIIWLKVPSYPADSKDGVPGTQKLDRNNPDLVLRARPILGLR